MVKLMCQNPGSKSLVFFTTRERHFFVPPLQDRLPRNRKTAFFFRLHAPAFRQDSGINEGVEGIPDLDNAHPERVSDLDSREPRALRPEGLCRVEEVLRDGLGEKVVHNGRRRSPEGVDVGDERSDHSSTPFGILEF